MSGMDRLLIKDPFLASGDFLQIKYYTLLKKLILSLVFAE